MHFDSFTDFIAMGGYSVYVWSSVLITLISIAALAISSIWTKKAIFNRIAGELERAAKIKQARQRAKAAETQNN